MAVPRNSAGTGARRGPRAASLKFLIKLIFHTSWAGWGGSLGAGERRGSPSGAGDSPQSASCEGNFELSTCNSSDLNNWLGLGGGRSDVASQRSPRLASRQLCGSVASARTFCGHISWAWLPVQPYLHGVDAQALLRTLEEAIPKECSLIQITHTLLVLFAQQRCSVNAAAAQRP